MQAYKPGSVSPPLAGLLSFI